MIDNQKDGIGCLKDKENNFLEEGFYISNELILTLPEVWQNIKMEELLII